MSDVVGEVLAREIDERMARLATIQQDFDAILQRCKELSGFAEEIEGEVMELMDALKNEWEHKRMVE